MDQGLVVASTWVKAVLLPHILLDSCSGAVAAAQAPKLHVNRRVTPAAAIHKESQPSFGVISHVVYRRLGLEMALRSCEGELFGKGRGDGAGTPPRNKR